MSKNKIVRIKGLSYKIGKRHVLQGINWEIEAGERWLLYGMNGSGKTTLLSMIAGFQHYTEGNIEIANSTGNVGAMPRKIGFVSSSFFDRYYGDESVFDIVLSGKFGTLGIESYMGLEDIKKIKQLLREMNMEEKMYRSYSMLSKGERQSVLLARAMMAEPEILLLDEPYSGLDVYNQRCLQRKIELLVANKNLTLIYVTHHAEEINPAFFNKILLLKNGRMYTQGDFIKIIETGKVNDIVGHGIRVTITEDGFVRFDDSNMEFSEQAVGSI